MFKNCFTICIDMDDTIEDLLTAWLTWLNTKYGYSVSSDQVTVWGMEKLYPTLTYTQIFEPLSDKAFWRTVKPLPEAQQYLQKLIDAGQDIYIVTSAKYDTVRPKIEECLLKYFPMIDYHKIIIAYNKQMIKCDILIDDGIQNLINGDYYKILVDAPYNQNIPEGLNCKRVFSWAEIYQTICDLDWFYTCENKQTINY